VHALLLHNGELRDTREPLLKPGQIGYLNGWGIFSTLRVKDGVLFAYERHYARMSRDSIRMRVPMPYSADELHGILMKLVEANQAYNATLRLSVTRNKGGLFEAPDQMRDTDLIAFTADIRSWANTVRLSYIPNARHGASPFAGAKITSWAQNLTWYEEAHERGYDEVILLNELGQISECTSANIFIISGDEVLTPPTATSGCLAGVTRAVLLEEVDIPGLRIRESELTPSQLESADQVFITSTTRDLLPVAEVDGVALNQSPDRLSQLRAEFVKYRERYTASSPYRKQHVLT
jgi:branched-chain amino acid aminotransferase